MAPKAERRIVKKLSKVHKEGHGNKGGGTSKSTMGLQKRNLADVVVSRWSKEELEKFYEAYRKHGKDWKKVAAFLRNRSEGAVSDLYCINREYLSLPEGIATSSGLIAKMTDLYDIMETKGGGKESADLPETSVKTRRKDRAEIQVDASRGSFNHHPDHLHTTSSTHGCLLQLRKMNSGDRMSRSLPRAVGKRTPRILVEYLHNRDYRDGAVSCDIEVPKSKIDVCAADGSSHAAIPALEEAPQVAGSLQVFGMLAEGADNTGSHPEQCAEAEMVNMPTRSSRRKMCLEKAMILCRNKSLDKSENVGPTKHLLSANKSNNLKEELCHCLSCQLLRRWCAFEWLYSAVDYPWYATCALYQYLKFVKLDHIPGTTLMEWSFIKSCLGGARRFSKQFLLEERKKLKDYRETVRTCYTEAVAGSRKVHPTYLGRPLSVGQHVVVYHPKTREFHDGKVLTVHHSQYRVQFDQPDLGVEYVMDINCMPLSSWEDMPHDLIRESSLRTNTCSAHKMPAADIRKLKEKGVLDEIVASKQTLHGQPSVSELIQFQAKVADRAFAELTRALDKKISLRAMSCSGEGGVVLLRIEEAISSVDNRHIGGNCSSSRVKPIQQNMHYLLIPIRLIFIWI